MSEHTKEPWYASETDDGLIEIVNDERTAGEFVSIADVMTGFDGKIGIEQAANARRIVAAVNACKGIPTNLLENRTDIGAAEVSRLMQLEQQRDKLMAALENIIAITNDSQGVAGYHLNGDIAEWDSFQEIAEAEAVIAEAKGGSK